VCKPLHNKNKQIVLTLNTEPNNCSLKAIIVKNYIKDEIIIKEIIIFPLWLFL